jgi:LEM3 (ligand-effect modulator 3) family / CDC50 family
VKSVDEGQLQGINKTADQLISDGGCTPLTLAPNGLPYYPCGLIANSLFNGIPLLKLVVDTRYIFSTCIVECRGFICFKSNL